MGPWRPVSLWVFLEKVDHLTRWGTKPGCHLTGLWLSRCSLPSKYCHCYWEAGSLGTWGTARLRSCNDACPGICLVLAWRVRSWWWYRCWSFFRLMLCRTAGLHSGSPSYSSASGEEQDHLQPPGRIVTYLEIEINRLASDHLQKLLQIWKSRWWF